MTVTLYGALAATALGIVVAGSIVRARQALSGTTMMAAWWWSLGAVASVVTAELAIAMAGAGAAGWREPCRYVAAMASFCPAMAVLGAKRPQSRAWQWVVASLWLVLSLPGVESLVLSGEGRVAPFVAWKLFVALLACLELFNWMTISRYGPAAGAVVAGQAMLVVPHFAGVGELSAGWAIGALAWWLLATWLVASRTRGTEAGGMLADWRRFCDWYGAFWAARVMGLVNQTATVARWPVRLAPRGLVRAEEGSVVRRETETIPLEELSEETAAGVRRALENTLRRFLEREE